MLTFPLKLNAGTVTITNEATTNKTVSIYVNNKDSVAVTLPASQTITIETLSAGESFMYLLQAGNGLKVELAAAGVGG